MAEFIKVQLNFKFYLANICSQLYVYSNYAFNITSLMITIRFYFIFVFMSYTPYNTINDEAKGFGFWQI